MVDFIGIIDENIRAIKRSEFRKQYQTIFEKYETAMKNNNVGIIDLADNLCYEDSCEVISPIGYAIYSD
jgi:hypothetical protein